MKKYNEVVACPNPITTQNAIVIDEDKCISCNSCVDACRMSLLLPNNEGGAPIVMYPDECWFCAVCVGVCPTNALKMEHPINQCAGWKRKSTGEFFRIGMKNNLKITTEKPTGE